VPAGNAFPTGTTTITYTATDAYGNVSTGTQTVSVTGAPPAFTPAANQNANEGASVNFALGSFTGGTGPYWVSVNWGDGTSKLFSVSAAGAVSTTHTYANDRATPYTVTVTVFDSTNASSSGSFLVTVANVAPTVTATSPAAGSTVQKNAAVSGSASFSDAGTTDTHTCTITWGDGSTSTGTVSESGGAGTCTGSHAYSATGPYTITFKVTDSSGASTSASTSISVVAPPPLAFTAGSNATVNEGATTTFSLGTFSGGVGPYSVTVTWGDGTSSTFSASPGAISASHKYANDQATPYSVSVKVTDSTGAFVTGSISVTVRNVAPTVAITTPAAGSLFKTGSTVSVSASFSDAGVGDTHTCKITWGDGTTSNGTVSESAGAGTCTGTRAFASVGNYTITVTVTDNAGGAASATVAISVTKTGKGLFQPGGTSSNLVLLPFKVAKVKHTAHGLKKAKHHVARKHVRSTTLSAQLRRILSFDPKPAPRL